MCIYFGMLVATLTSGLCGVVAAATVTVTDPQAIAFLSEIDHAMQNASDKVMDCVHKKLAERADCVCRYPRELAEVKLKGQAALQAHPEWKEETISWDSENPRLSHAVSFPALRKQSEIQCQDNKVVQYDMPDGRMTPGDTYTLLQTAEGQVIQVTTGKRGERVQLLKNPTFAKMDEGGKAVTVPLSLTAPVWENVPDARHKMLVGTVYVVKDSKIVQVFDRNGNDITGE